MSDQGWGEDPQQRRRDAGDTTPWPGAPEGPPEQAGTQGGPGGVPPGQPPGQAADPGQAPPPGHVPPPGYGPPPGHGPPPGYGAGPGPYGGAPGWGAPPGYAYPYAPPRETDQSAVWALVCAIGAWVVLPVVLAVVALVLASHANRDIAASGGFKEGQGIVQAARLIAWLNLAFAGFFVVLGLVVVAVALAAAA